MTELKVFFIFLLGHVGIWMTQAQGNVSLNPSSAPSFLPSLFSSTFSTVAPTLRSSSSPTDTPTLRPSPAPTTIPSETPTEPLVCEEDWMLIITADSDLFEVGSEAIKQWEQIQSTFTMTYYNVDKNLAEDESEVEIFEMTTSYAYHVTLERESPSRARHLQAGLTRDGLVCEIISASNDSNDSSVSRSLQASVQYFIYIYFSACLRYRIEDESSILRAGDILSYPLAGRLGRLEYTDSLKSNTLFQDAISVSRMQKQKVPDTPSESPSGSPTLVPSTQPTFTYLTADDTWEALINSIMITSCAAIMLLTIFEICRRQPIVADVFDRRRSTKPYSTPPPLMKQTYYEWLRVNTSPGYTVWAREEARKESNANVQYGLRGLDPPQCAPEFTEEVGLTIHVLILIFVIAKVFLFREYQEKMKKVIAVMICLIGQIMMKKVVGCKIVI